MRVVSAGMVAVFVGLGCGSCASWFDPDEWERKRRAEERARGYRDEPSRWEKMKEWERKRYREWWVGSWDWRGSRARSEVHQAAVSTNVPSALRGSRGRSVRSTGRLLFGGLDEVGGGTELWGDGEGGFAAVGIDLPVGCEGLAVKVWW